MNLFTKIIIGIFLIFIMITIFFIAGDKNLSSNESMMINIILIIISVFITWFITHYYSKDLYKNAVEQANDENRSKIKMYALKAAEKVNNLSRELSNLAIYLDDELEQDYEDIKEENLSREERLRSSIHIIKMLKSVNDTSLSDWKGVIGEELEEREEEKREKHEEALSMLERYEELSLNNINQKNDKQNNLNKNNKNITKEIKDLKKKIDYIIGDISDPRVISKKRKKKRLKENTMNICPDCKRIINYEQRPYINSTKNIKCECGKDLVGRWSRDKNFYLEIIKVVEEKINCPNCQSIINTKLSTKLHSKITDRCNKCNKLYKVTRIPGELLIKTIGEQQPKIKEKLTDDLLKKIKESLPKQPWPSGTHKKIAEELKIPKSLASKAINTLMKKGEVSIQINGKIYTTKDI